MYPRILILNEALPQWTSSPASMGRVRRIPNTIALAIEDFMRSEREAGDPSGRKVY